MSEVTQSTQEVIHQFPCSGCGADMVFDVEKQALSCPYCENIIEINAENSS